MAKGKKPVKVDPSPKTKSPITTTKPEQENPGLLDHLLADPRRRAWVIRHLTENHGDGGETIQGGGWPDGIARPKGEK